MRDDAAGYRRLVAYLRELYAVEMPHFIDRNLDSPVQLVGAPLLRLVGLGGFRRLAPKIATFLRDERLRRIFTFQAMYAGVAPTQALAIYAVITYLDCVGGVYFPEGGLHAVPRALAGAGTKHGVTIRYGTSVTRIEVTNGRARAVHTASGERIPADVVVVNGDLAVAYRSLFTTDGTPRRVRRLRYSPSCVLLHAGSTRRLRRHRASHDRIRCGLGAHVSGDHRRRAVDERSVVPDHDADEVRSDARSGRQARVLRAVPGAEPRSPPSQSTGTRKGPGYRERLISAIEARGYRGFADAIEVERLVTPLDWAGAGLAAGTPFAAAHTFWQTGPFRPSTMDRRIENLLFCGGNTQPGVGVPMALISGRLAAERVIGPRRTGRARDEPRRSMPPVSRTRDYVKATNSAAQLNARHGRTYYLATLLLPRVKRRYVHALYGFRPLRRRHRRALGDDRQRERRLVSWSDAGSGRSGTRTIRRSGLPRGHRHHPPLGHPGQPLP